MKHICEEQVRQSIENLTQTFCIIFCECRTLTFVLKLLIDDIHDNLSLGQANKKRKTSSNVFGVHRGRRRCFGVLHSMGGPGRSRGSGFTQPLASSRRWSFWQFFANPQPAINIKCINTFSSWYVDEKNMQELLYRYMFWSSCRHTEVKCKKLFHIKFVIFFCIITIWIGKISGDISYYYVVNVE